MTFQEGLEKTERAGETNDPNLFIWYWFNVLNISLQTSLHFAFIVLYCKYKSLTKSKVCCNEFVKNGSLVAGKLVNFDHT